MYIAVKMWFTLAVLSLLFVNADAQIQECLCYLEQRLQDLYNGFHLTLDLELEWDDEISKNARNEALKPENKTKHSPSNIIIKLQETSSKDSKAPADLYERVKELLDASREKFKKITNLRIGTKYGCNGYINGKNDDESSDYLLTIVCLYKTNVEKESP